MAHIHCSLRYLTPTIDSVSLFSNGKHFLLYFHYTTPHSSPPLPQFPANSALQCLQSSSQWRKLNKQVNIQYRIPTRKCKYASEFLGIATSFFNPPSKAEAPETAVELARDGSGVVDRVSIVKSMKDDFERSYFVTGNLSLDAYEEDCEFADPASSFKGLQRFKRNCTNFGSLLKRSNMKLMKWEDFEDKGIGHWRFSCILSFPWRPILSASGYTEYYFDEQSGKVSRHVEHWNVPKMILLKQILKPSRRFWDKKTGG